VVDLPLNGFEVATEIGRIASEAGRPEERANAILDSLRRLVPFQAGNIQLLDLRTGACVSLARRGYPAAVTAYIDSQANTEEVEFLGLTRDRRPMRVQDLPVQRDKIHGWVHYLRPAGFREGMAVGLFTADGRHLGVLGLNTDTERHPSAATRDLIGRLTPVIAGAVDPMRSLTSLARMVHDATAGIVLDRDGSASPLPGLGTHPVLAPASAVALLAARRLAEGAAQVAFLAPYHPPESSAPEHVRVTVLACPRQPLHDTAGLVLVSPPGDLEGLTRRELEVLGLIIEGWPNPRIAAQLRVAERTAAAHVEHILEKLGARSRTLAAVRALRRGLYVPREISMRGPAGPG
jgi:DNA-binding CsgD family transcriptional regulator